MAKDEQDAKLFYNSGITGRIKKMAKDEQDAKLYNNSGTYAAKM